MARRKRYFLDWFNLFVIEWIAISDTCLSAFCLRDLKIFVPDAVVAGTAARLSCQYDLEQAALYSVRWYFDTEEFYRYVPKESPPGRAFPASGLNVDLSTSDSHAVTLRSVTKDLTGNFQCEVSEDAPLFHTDIRLAHMQVIELPKADPFLQIDKQIIGPTDFFKAICTVGKSYPPANITWFVNGRRVYKSPFQRISYHPQEGSSTFSTLEMYPHSQIMQSIFQPTPKFHTSILVLCEVSILRIYQRNVQQRIFLSRMALTTMSPNLLGLEGSKRGNEPDNSPLTGGANGVHPQGLVLWIRVTISLGLSIPLKLIFNQHKSMYVT
ncbi:uncharacterized protein LOC119651678 isoform X2 [Hermetia illucens]|nr:uncharacterized protein LOC119651678 isoform X2 [Hermetia illucens]